MLISDSHHFLFTHVPKAAGSSVTAALAPYALPRPGSTAARALKHIGFPRNYRKYRFSLHAPLRTAQAHMPPEVYASVFKFAFVRNPWGQLVSEYNSSINKQRRLHHRRVAGAKTFLVYLQYEHKRGKIRQVELLLDRSGKIDVDFLGRFENLVEDFRVVCDRIGIESSLPTLNKHAHKDYHEYYDDESRQFVRDHWANDIEALGYDF